MLEAECLLMSVGKVREDCSDHCLNSNMTMVTCNCGENIQSDTYPVSHVRLPSPTYHKGHQYNVPIYGLSLFRVVN